MSGLISRGALSWVLGISAFMLTSVSAIGQTLLWEESNDNLAVTAANSLGLAPTVVTDEAAFTTAFNSGGWSFVIIDQPANGISAANATSIANYITGGGRVLLSFWDMDGSFAPIPAATLRPAFGVAAATEYTTSLPVNVWAPGHPVFTTPNAIPATINTDGTDPWADDGDRFTVAVGAQALAGYTAAPTAGEAAIIIANGGRTIVNGFMSDNMTPTVATALLANEMNTLIPEPTSGLALIASGIMLVSRRRR